VTDHTWTGVPSVAFTANENIESFGVAFKSALSPVGEVAVKLTGKVPLSVGLAFVSDVARMRAIKSAYD
jgi:hypothetical protein